MSSTLGSDVAGSAVAPGEVAGSASAPSWASEPPSQREAAARTALTGFGRQVGPYGIFVGCWAAVLPVAFLSTIDYPSFTPKYAVMLLMAGAGLVPLARLAWRRSSRWMGCGLVGFLLVGLVSALLSQSPNIGIMGLYRWGSGWLFWLACAGAFAVGASLRGTDVQWAFYGLVVGAVANALMAVYQIVLHPTSEALRAYAGNTQADGFLGNPVHLEALLLGAIALVATKVCDSPRRWWWAPLLFGVALEMTSERVFIPILLVIFAVAIVTRGRRGLLFSALAGAGCLIGYVGGGSALGSRVSSGTAETTFGLRFQLWHDALVGLVHHPFLGSGPGEVIAGTAPYVDRSFGHALDGRLFTDAHNFIVEVLVTTGLLGLAFFLVWLLPAARRARGPFLGFALAVAAVKLVEPLNIGVAPLAFLAFGVAVAGWLASRESRTGAELERSAPAALREGSVSSRLLSAVAVALALALGGTMLLGDYQYSKTQLGLQQLPAANEANELMPYWPETSAELGFYWRYEYAISHGTAVKRADLEAARRAYVTTASRDSADPSVWWFVGQMDQLLGRSGPAAVAYRHSLTDYPWYPPSLGSLAGIDVGAHHWAAAVRLYRELAAIQPLSPTQQALFTEARAHVAS